MNSTTVRGDQKIDETNSLADIQSKLAKLAPVNGPGWQRTVLTSLAEQSAYHAVIRDWMHRAIVEYPNGCNPVEQREHDETLMIFDRFVRDGDHEFFDALRWSVICGGIMSDVEMLDDLLDLDGSGTGVPISDRSRHTFAGHVTSALTDATLDVYRTYDAVDPDAISGIRALVIPMPQHQRMDAARDDPNRDGFIPTMPACAGLFDWREQAINMTSVQFANFIRQSEWEFGNPAETRLQFDWSSVGPWPILPGLSDEYDLLGIYDPVSWLTDQKRNDHGISQFNAWLFTDESTGHPTEFFIIIAHDGLITP